MQYNYGQAAANAAQQRNMEMWNQTNFGAQRQHMEDAGLSVGLMYGGGGQGAVSQGGQATQPSGPTSNPVGMALQYKQIEQQNEAIKSQTILNQAEAAKALADAKKTSGVDTNKVTNNFVILRNIRKKRRRIIRHMATEALKKFLDIRFRSESKLFVFIFFFIKINTKFWKIKRRIIILIRYIIRKMNIGDIVPISSYRISIKMISSNRCMFIVISQCKEKNSNRRFRLHFKTFTPLRPIEMLTRFAVTTGHIYVCTVNMRIFDLNRMLTTR